MSRRSTELLMLSIAAIIVLIMYGILIATNGIELHLTNFLVPLGIIFSFVVAHFAVRKLSPDADPVILPIVLVLSGIGITFITRLAPDLALRQVM